MIQFSTNTCLRFYWAQVQVNQSLIGWAIAQKLSSPGVSIFFECTSALLYTDGTFLSKYENFQDYLKQHFLKSGSTKEHFK